MKKHLIAAAALATLSTVTFAQNATVYGVIDSGLIYQNKTQATGNKAAVTQFNNGGMSPSIIGFRGTEDLGGGLKANFNLEGHYLSSTGQGSLMGGLFGRQANVGLSNASGSLALGRQYTPAVLAYASTDPRGLKEQFSGLMTWATTTGAGTNTNQTIDVFSGQSVSFNTKVAGVNLGALYGFGGVAGDTSAGRQISAGATYTVNGLTLSYAYQEANGTAANNGKVNEKNAVGAAYAMGDITVKANFLKAKATNATTGAVVTNGEQEVTGLGVDYKWNSKNTLTVAYYDGKTKNVANSDAKSYIISNDYSLSKRTTFYALVGIANLDASASQGTIAAQTATGLAANGYTLNATTTSYQVGINHKF
jgi:predicted porin